jgi:hypothetical protein
MATGQTHGGKGSAARPTDKKKYEDNYDAIFGKNKQSYQAEILINKMRTPDGTMLESKHRHDYVTHMDANGKEYMLDGGLDYVRCSAHGDEEMYTLMSDDDHGLIRVVVTWGTYGREGDQLITHVLIADMETEHLQACIDGMRGYPRPAMYKVMQDELEYRNEN